MLHDDLTYIGHMLDMAQKAIDKAHGKTRSDFNEDEDLRIVLTHLIQVIGEAARGVSQEFQIAHPEIPWKEIVGMRHKVVHDYMNVDEEVVWDTVQNELLPLIKELKKIIPSK
jgi:uncharacterized protein with HEPN domain